MPTSTRKVAIEVTMNTPSNIVNVGILGALTLPSVLGGGPQGVRQVGDPSEVPAMGPLGAASSYMLANLPVLCLLNLKFPIKDLTPKLINNKKRKNIF